MCSTAPTSLGCSTNSPNPPNGTDPADDGIAQHQTTTTTVPRSRCTATIAAMNAGDAGPVTIEATPLTS